MPSLYAIAVIGQRGQLVVPADTPWFREMTWGKELVAGDDVWYEAHNMVGRTFLSPEQFWDPQHLKEYVRHTATENIFLIGGAETFAKFAGVVDRWYIDKTGYDGQSDEWFNPMWLVAEKG